MPKLKSLAAILEALPEKPSRYQLEIKKTLTEIFTRLEEYSKENAEAQEAGMRFFESLLIAQQQLEKNALSASTYTVVARLITWAWQQLNSSPEKKGESKGEGDHFIISLNHLLVHLKKNQVKSDDPILTLLTNLRDSYNNPENFKILHIEDGGSHHVIAVTYDKNKMAIIDCNSGSIRIANTSAAFRYYMTQSTWLSTRC